VQPHLLLDKDYVGATEAAVSLAMMMIRLKTLSLLSLGFLAR
jgi:hypothetical protein